MVQSEKQQAERNIQKHINYIMFLNKHYKGDAYIYPLIGTIKKLIRAEKSKI